MLIVDDVVREALKTTQKGGLEAIARYRGSQQAVNLDPSGSVTFRGNAEIQGSGSARAFGFGDSLVPKQPTDFLAANGQELAIWRTIRLRANTWRIPLGVYKITRAGDSLERYRKTRVLDWHVNLTLKDRFEQIQADDFLAVDSPVPGNSVWEEVSRLSPIPVTSALGDAEVPASTVYESRLGAITALLSILGGVPHMTREGILTARLADAWLLLTDPQFTIDGVIDWSGETTNDFANQVQVTNPNDKTIVAYAQLLDPWNPRAVQNAGGRTYKFSSPILDTLAKAQTAAETILARKSTQRSTVVTITAAPETLLLELGDFGWFRDLRQRRAVLGEVSGIRVSFDPTLPPVVDVIPSREVQLEVGNDDLSVTSTIHYPYSGLFPDNALFPGGSA